MHVSSTGIGETLRRAREARRLSIADLERLTKIRGTYLAALEEGRIETLPPRPYAKGFVRAYARALGLDADRLAAEFEAGLPPADAPSLIRAVEIPLEPAAPIPRWRRLVGYALWVVLIAALFFGYVGYTQFREFARSGLAPAPVASPAPFQDVPSVPTGATPAATAKATPVPAVVASPPPAAGTISLALTTTGISWVRVIADGERLFQGILQEGEARTWAAERELTIRIGNASAVDLTLNGRSLGALGRPGEVVELRFPREREER